MSGINNLNIKDKKFLSEFNRVLPGITELYYQLYAKHEKAEEAFDKLLQLLATLKENLDKSLKFNSRKKQTDWFLSNELVGMSLYVDRFCGTLKAMPEKLNQSWC
jgi:amylosucrase